MLHLHGANDKEAIRQLVGWLAKAGLAMNGMDKSPPSGLIQAYQAQDSGSNRYET